MRTFLAVEGDTFDSVILCAPTRNEVKRGLPSLAGASQPYMESVENMRCWVELIIDRRPHVPLYYGEVRNVILANDGGGEMFIGVLKHGCIDSINYFSKYQWFDSVTSAYEATNNALVFLPWASPSMRAAPVMAGQPTYIQMARYCFETRFVEILPEGRVMDAFIDAGERGALFIGVLHQHEGDGFAWSDGLVS